jgi:hypothetical protein
MPRLPLPESIATIAKPMGAVDQAEVKVQICLYPMKLIRSFASLSSLCARPIPFNWYDKSAGMAHCAESRWIAQPEVCACYKAKKDRSDGYNAPRSVVARTEGQFL